MYQLFYKWYATKKDVEIKRTKIYLEEDDNDNLNIAEEKNKINEDNNINNINNIESNISPNSNKETGHKISISKIHLNNINDKISFNSTGKHKLKCLTKNYSYLKGVNKKTNQNFELEIYPVFFFFFNYFCFIFNYFFFWRLCFWNYYFFLFFLYF